ncbi:MAG: hypothetical protein JWM78_633 [Verrucomicrobiaceae bacterium]|nr:hypothetical protein [Verrucomicrobiaceae bacterium]
MTAIGFALKKIISACVMPLSLIVFLLTFGCVCLWLKRYRAARWCVTSSLVLLLVVSCTAISDLSLLPLEEQYAKWDGRASDLALVVVMGASQSDAPRLPLTNRPNSAAIYRLLEGLAVYRANPGSKLILSGDEVHPELMSRVAVAIGVPAADILLQARSHDTEEEVKLLAPMVVGQRFAVVTSAAHMPRTMQLFHAAGLEPQAVPAHFLDRDNPHPNWHDFKLPDADSIARTEFAAHEYMGLAWLSVKAWFE